MHGGGGGSSDAPSAIDTGSGASHAPVTLQMWGEWTGRELRQFNKIFDGFTQKYPWITVNSVGGVNDQKIHRVGQLRHPAGRQCCRSRWTAWDSSARRGHGRT